MFGRICHKQSGCQVNHSWACLGTVSPALSWKEKRHISRVGGRCFLTVQRLLQVMKSAWISLRMITSSYQPRFSSYYTLCFKAGSLWSNTGHRSTTWSWHTLFTLYEWLHSENCQKAVIESEDPGFKLWTWAKSILKSTIHMLFRSTNHKYLTLFIFLGLIGVVLLWAFLHIFHHRLQRCLAHLVFI